jgi:hypothetical protein
MPVTNTDAVLWYNVDQFGQAGYGVPNPSNDVGSLNRNILELCNMVGQNLFAIMHHEDADLSTPPSINTIRRLHKLYIRFGQIIEARAVSPGENNMEPLHTSPAGEVFKVYPIPFFLVRNRFMREWAELSLMALSEAMQHQENRKPIEISTTFAAAIGKYFKRIYFTMATELFGKTRAEAQVLGFILTEEELGKYDPSKFFTSTEMVDTVPHLGMVFTEDRLRVLRAGIPVTSLPELQPWPTNLTSYYAAHVAFGSAVPNAEGSQSSDPSATASASAGGGPVIPDVQP